MEWDFFSPHIDWSGAYDLIRSLPKVCPIILSVCLSVCVYVCLQTFNFACNVWSIQGTMFLVGVHIPRAVHFQTALGLITVGRWPWHWPWVYVSPNHILSPVRHSSHTLWNSGIHLLGLCYVIINLQCINYYVTVSHYLCLQPPLWVRETGWYNTSPCTDVCRKAYQCSILTSCWTPLNLLMDVECQAIWAISYPSNIPTVTALDFAP